MIDLEKLTIRSAHESLVRGDFTARELAETYLQKIREVNGDFFAYIEVYDDVLSQADDADRRIKEGKVDLMTGIPIAVKDNMLVDGKIASSASKILEHYRCTYDATIISKLKHKGAVLVGRTNMDDSAMGSSTETSAYGVTRNPLDPKLVPGGSSGGSAAAVAMNGALVSLGSDTGGSIREPASFCGLVGMKPTYGLVSRYGLMAMSSSLDQIGPLAKTVDDAQILFHSISSYDPNDATSIPNQIRKDEVRVPKKIGIPRSWLSGEGIDPSIMSEYERACEVLEMRGFELVDVELPMTKYSLAVYYVLQPAEVSSNLARYDGIRYGLSVPANDIESVYSKTKGEGFGKEVRRRIILGTYILSHGYYDAYYRKSVDVRNAITEELNKILLKGANGVDAIFTPTSPFTPFAIGERMDDPIAMKMSDLFTVPANIAGLPAISVPFGKDKKGMPIGMQFMGPSLEDDMLFDLAKVLEEENK